MLKQRVVTAVILIAVFLAADFFLPTWAWAALILVPVLLGAVEWATLAGFSPGGRHAFVTAVGAGCAALFFLPDIVATPVFIAWAVFWVTVVPLWLARAWKPRAPLLLALAGWLVLVPSWSGTVMLHKSPGLLLALLAVVWIADSAAYFAGRRFGRNKLAPRISPGKTWEGVGGAVAAVLMYAFILQRFVFVDLPELRGAQIYLLVLGMTVLGILGDLYESWMKRVAGVKDSGTLLPGHGGVLDRIDALTASVPLAALWTALNAPS